jgi:hypothetical protein
MDIYECVYSMDNTGKQFRYKVSSFFNLLTWCGYGCRAIQFASKNDELLQALEEDSDSSDKASAWGRRRVRQRLDPASPGTSMEGSQQVEDLGSLGRRSQEAIKKTPPVTPGQRLPNGVWGTARTAWSKDARKLVLRAQRSAWPQWVYRQYDAYDLARRAAGM